MPDKATIAVVTGASRGAGKGIAIGLGRHGCTVYVTGRSEKTGDATLPGTIYETAAAVTAAGGKGIAVRVDHADDEQVRALFEQVEREAGRVDILVNNAAAVYDEFPYPGLWLYAERPFTVLETAEERAGALAAGRWVLVQQRDLDELPAEVQVLIGDRRPLPYRWKGMQLVRGRVPAVAR